MCATVIGITTFHPLKRHVKPGSKVGIIGIGGLGHVAIQYAAKMGGVVTAISRSDSKREQAQLIPAPRVFCSCTCRSLS